MEDLIYASIGIRSFRRISHFIWHFKHQEPKLFLRGVYIYIPKLIIFMHILSLFTPFRCQTFQRGLPKVPRSMSGIVSQSVSQFVSVCIFFSSQNSHQATSRSCREMRFCLEVICTSQHTSNHHKSLAEQCHTQNFNLTCFKSDFDDVTSKFDLLIEQIEKTTSNEY